MNPFTYYFQRARHLSVYQYTYLTPRVLPATLIFPYVTKLTLIDCSRSGISHLLYPSRFPKLEEIHYLSGHPGHYTIYERFPKSVKWVFPNRDYAFYNCMLEAGYGEKNNHIISSNIYGIKAVHPMISFNIHIPGHGMRDGSFYKTHMYQYFHHPEVLSTLPEKELIPQDKQDVPMVSFHQENPLQRYERSCLEQEFFDHIMKSG